MNVSERIARAYNADGVSLRQTWNSAAFWKYAIRPSMNSVLPRMNGERSILTFNRRNPMIESSSPKCCSTTCVGSWRSKSIT